MGITAEQKFLLNRMNSTAFKVGLGDLLDAADSVVAGDIALADGAILIGGALGVAAGIVPTGDVTVTNAGVTAIGANKVVTAKILDANVTLAKLSSGAAPIKHVVGMGLFTTAGGDANESITVAGCLGTDTALVWVQKAGTVAKTVDTITPGTGAIAVVLSGDPSTDHQLGWIVTRAAS